MRSTKSSTSSSLNALSSDSIGTRVPHLGEPRDGAAPTRFDGESARIRSGKRASIAALRLRSASYSASLTGRGVVLVIALVMRADLEREPHQLGLGLGRRELDRLRDA